MVLCQIQQEQHKGSVKAECRTEEVAAEIRPRMSGPAASAVWLVGCHSTHSNGWWSLWMLTKHAQAKAAANEEGIGGTNSHHFLSVCVCIMHAFTGRLMAD